MTVGTTHLGQISDVDRVLEGRNCGWGCGGSFCAFCLRHDSVALGAVFADYLAVGAGVLAVVAAEASVVVVVAEIVGMRLPVQLHFGERGAPENILDFGDRVTNFKLLGFRNLGIFALVKSLNSAGDAVNRFVGCLVSCGQYGDGL